MWHTPCKGGWGRQQEATAAAAAVEAPPSRLAAVAHTCVSPMTMTGGGGGSVTVWYRSRVMWVQSSSQPAAPPRRRLLRRRRPYYSADDWAHRAATLMAASHQTGRPKTQPNDKQSEAGGVKDVVDKYRVKRRDWIKLQTYLWCNILLLAKHAPKWCYLKKCSRWCHDHSDCDKYLKLKAYAILIKRYNLLTSDFLYRWSGVGLFSWLPPPPV